MLITSQTGTASTWPTFTFTKKEKTVTNAYEAGSIAPNMPLRAIPGTMNEVSVGSGKKDLGHYLAISADWSAVSGGAKTALWNIEIWGLDFGGTPVASAV